MMMRFVGISMVAFLAASTALAEVCPDDIPADSGLRRAQAKKWFAKGDEATNNGDDLAALKAFQCSLKFIPHGFTAYNMGQIAERIGDLELAIASYKQYLLLVPDAKDAPEVTRKIDSLKERLAQVRASEQDLNPLLPAGPPSPAKAAAVPASAAPAARDGKQVESLSSSETPAPSSHVAAWVAFGSAGLLLGAAVVTNLAARSKMDTCNTKWVQQDRPGAETACSDATPLAYSSYGLFAAGGVAAAVGAILYLRPTPSSTLAMGILPQGGLSLRLRGHF